MRGSFHCLHGDSEPEQATELEPHQITLPRADGDFHLIPVAAGAGRTGKIIFSIVIGGALIATGVGGALAAGAAAGATGTAAGAAAGLAASSAILGLSHGTLILMGASFLLGGINMLLTPTPKEGNGGKPTTFTFGGPANVGDEGVPVPLVYGEVIWGSVPIASSIRTGFGGWGNGGYSGWTGSDGVTAGGGRQSFDFNYNEVML
jgi:predicted phage tail protein